MTPLEEIEHLASVPLDLEVELDRKVLTVREILELSAGSVLRLNRSAGENVDILAGEHLIGFGEIVVIEDTMGIRVTDFFNEE
jgi:flagellar motor switch protein FliN/FliY